MRLVVAPCHFRHPSKPPPTQYAGHSPGYLIKISDYDNGCEKAVLEEELRKGLGKPRLKLDRQITALLLDGGDPPSDHLEAVLDVLTARGKYGGSQAIVWHAHAEHPFAVLRAGIGYPWDSHWKTEIAPGLLRI